MYDHLSRSAYPLNSRTGFPGYTGSMTWTNVSAKGVVSYSSADGVGSGLIARDYLTKSGWGIKGWRDLLDRGEIIVTPYYRVKSTRSSGGGSGTWTHTSGASATVQGTGSFSVWAQAWYQLSDPVWPTIDASTLDKRAKLAALSNIDRSRWSLLEDIAEAREGFRTLVRPAESAITQARRLDKMINKVGVKYQGRNIPYQALRTLSTAYLETKFGLAQLFYTAMKLGDEYENRIALLIPDEKRPIRSKAVGSVKSFAEKQTVLHNSSVLDCPYITFGQSVQGEFRAGVFYRMKYPRDHTTLAWRYGIHYKEVVPTLFELIRLSWLTERFISIGDSIRAVENFLDPEVTIDGAYTASKITLRSERTVSGWRQGGLWTVSPSSDAYKSVEDQYIVNPWIPSLFDVLPVTHFRDGLSLATCTDALSLLALKLGPVRERLRGMGINDLGRHEGYLKPPKLPKIDFNGWKPADHDMLKRALGSRYYMLIRNSNP